MYYMVILCEIKQLEVVAIHTANRFVNLTTRNLFRDPTNYEVLRVCGLRSNTRLYTPKLEKDLKFVAHDATITNDFLCNKALYVEALQELINSSRSTDENKEKARGFLTRLKEDSLIVDLLFLGALTRILKRFSTEFQVIVDEMLLIELAPVQVEFENSHISVNDCQQPNISSLSPT